MSRSRLLRKQNILAFIGLSSTASLFIKFYNTSVRLDSKIYAKEKPNEKLIGVQLITRHGARTPLHLIPNIEQVNLDASRRFTSLILEINFYYSQATYTEDMLEPYVKANVILKSIGRAKIETEYSLYDQYNLRNILKVRV